MIKAKKAIEEFVGSGQLIVRLELRLGSTLKARALNFKALFEALILSLLFSSCCRMTRLRGVLHLNGADQGHTSTNKQASQK